MGQLWDKIAVAPATQGLELSHNVFAKMGQYCNSLRFKILGVLGRAY